MALLTALRDGALCPSLLRRLVEPIVDRWPAYLFAGLSGTLAFRDRAGSQTLTGSGAVRYQAASGARTNFFANPQLGTNATGWSTAGAATSARTADADFASGQCYQSAATASTSDGFDVVAQMRTVALSAATITVGVAAKVTAGATDWQARAQLVDAAGSVIGSAGSFVDLVPGATVARAVLTITNPTQAGGMGVQVQFRRKTAATSTIRVSDLTIESGSTAGTWFSPVWLDPVSGILGTAHASPSVSQAAAWVEEETTNLVTNPWFAVDTAGWTGSNGTLSRVTSFAYQGPGAGNVAATGANATFTISITAAASSHTAQVIVRNRHTASRTCQLKYNGSNIGSATAVAADETKTITAAFTGTGGAANLDVVWTDSANTENFVLYYAGAEAKAYATSPCPAINASGTIQTGFTWAGTAHASASTRAVALVFVAPTGRISTTRGSWIAWHKRTGSVSGTPRLLQIGSFIGNPGDHLSLTSTGANLSINATTNGGGASSATLGSGLALDTWAMAYGEWTTTTLGVAINNGAVTTAARAAVPAGSTSVDNVLRFGSDNGIQVGNALIGPVLIMDRPLTAMERERIYRLGPSSVGWDSARDSA